VGYGVGGALCGGGGMGVGVAVELVPASG